MNLKGNHFLSAYLRADNLPNPGAFFCDVACMHAWRLIEQAKPISFSVEKEEGASWEKIKRWNTFPSHFPMKVCRRLLNLLLHGERSKTFFPPCFQEKKTFSFFGTGKPSYKTVFTVAFPSKTWNCFVSCSFYVGTRKNGLDYFFFQVRFLWRRKCCT